MPARSLLGAALGRPIVDVERVRSLERRAMACGTALIVVGVAVLFGWIFDITALKSIHSTLSSMKPNTAIAFVVLGVSLRLRVARRAPRFSAALAAFAALIGALTIIGYVGATAGGLDALFNLPRMSPATAFNLLLIGAAILLLDVRVGASKQRPSEWLALLAAFTSLISLLGYLYGVAALYAVGPFRSIALHTTLTFTVAAAGVFLARPEDGLARVIFSDGAGGSFARRMLPAALFAPVIFGFLRLRGEQLGLYQKEFGLVLFATSNIVCFSSLTWWAARSVLVSDRDATTHRITEEVFRNLLDSAPDALVIVARDGKIALVNEQAAKMFGYSRTELLALTIDDLVPAKTRPMHGDLRASYFAAPIARPMGAGLDLRALHKDGTEFPVEISLSPIEVPAGTFVTAAIRDVTEARERREKEMHEKSAALAAENRRMQEASRLKSDFLANMSHELRTPLNAIIGFAELMFKGKVGPIADTHKEYLGDILTSSRHLLALINGVLDLAKIEAGKMEFARERVVVGVVVAEVRDILRELAAAKSLRVESTIASDVGEAMVDAAKLKQVLYNYLSNAIKFTEDGGKISIAVTRIGERIRIDVTDTGIGIRREDLPRLFQEFEQLDGSTTKRHGGTGLGLALTKKIVEAQGGEVGVESEPGHGSTFFVILPA